MIKEGDSGCHGFGVFGKAVASSLNNVPEEHGLTEDGKNRATHFHGFLFQKYIIPIQRVGILFESRSLAHPLESKAIRRPRTTFDGSTERWA